MLVRPSIVVMGLAFAVAAGACASSQPPAQSSPQAAAPADAEVKDLDRNLKEFGGEVKEFVSSAKTPASVEDPASFRGRVRAGERRLTERAGVLRQRIHSTFGTKPVPTTAPAPAAEPSHERQQQMLKDLDASEAQLAETRSAVKE